MISKFYPHVRNLLFSVDAETAHNFSLAALDDFKFLLTTKKYHNPVKLFGLEFPNPVGLAAGLDKNAAYLDGLEKLAFGFIEVGTVTPRPQLGNPKPRLFRLPEHNAIINRMGFNNNGVELLLDNIKYSKYKGILGINIGKNFDTPIEKAEDDYILGLKAVYPFADYITINISSPNTKNLRQLQESSELDKLLNNIKLEQENLQKQYNNYVPILLKIAPDLDESQIKSIAESLKKFNMDGVIATNTTISRDSISTHSLAKESGGLSGAPVRIKSLNVIKQLYAELGEQIPIIGVGGIFSLEDAQEKIDAGAKLVQVYTGLIYKGPKLVEEIAMGLKISR